MLVAYLNNPETLGSIQAMCEFAALYKSTPPKPPLLWPLAAFGVQVAEALGDDVLLQACIASARGSYSDVTNDNEEALRGIVLCGGALDCLRPYIDLRGDIGLYVASRAAELAFRAGDVGLLEAATARLAEYDAAACKLVDPLCEQVLAEVMLHRATHNHFQRDRLQQQLNRSSPLFRQRLLMDTARIFHHYKLGGEA